MAAEGSGSPTARGDNVAPASGAAPAFLATAATARVAGFRCALWSDGELFIHTKGGTLLLNPEETRQLVAYLERLGEGGA